MGPEISVYIDGQLQTKIHTSCSEPIGPGMVFGDFKVIDGYSQDGGRLCPEDNQAPDCGQCKGGVIRLTLQYMGSQTADVTIYKGKKKKDREILFAGPVSPGGEFTFSGKDKHQKMGPEICLYVNGRLHAKIHTSCSKPVARGMIFGDFEILDGHSKDGGRLPSND